MKILVTGATGFIGNNLLRRLIKENKIIDVIVRPDSKITSLKGSDKVNILEHDGTMEDMYRIIQKSNPKIVFHLATNFVSEHSSEDLDDMVTSNILYGTQLLEALSKTNCKNIVNTGTSWQHYKSSSYSPVNFYSSTKKAFEDILLFYHEARSFNVINLKLFDTYGPNDNRGKLFSLLMNAKDNNTILDMSAGEQLLDLVHVNDVIDALCGCIELFHRDTAFFDEYLISSGTHISLKKVVEIFSKVSGKDIVVNWGAREYRDREVMIPWNKGKLFPNWSAKIDLQKGIKDMIKDAI